ncbi:winged helix-turn-helix transcriptional regulator [Chitinophaga nivalis]|uniref:Helix-turn-helix transcriptional regulator n=1 Tax=Chitinophaga nivalis TaxID=2991709 RepID=A0ABT3IKL1_9BACT|nr:helix-turn-helix domain-containing protein [Chitinophaga nivalis]MCW3465804.1 helix-turn-helix transcriptional regulator [Chitinophaga nivalis]MCW3484505.1 helix-turn-helix transcriptional regulator [Chitinophaga nivalis]
MKNKIRVTANKICPLEHAVNTISGKWKIPIVWYLHQGARRPSDFFYLIAAVNRRVLTRQLKELEEQGIITKQLLKQKPLEVSWELTPLGDQLVKALWILNDWGSELLERQGVTGE